MDLLKSKKKDDIKRIYRKSKALLEVIDEENAHGGHGVVQVHTMDETSYFLRHTDKNDVLHQYWVLIGHYEGGNIITIDFNGKYHEFDVKIIIIKLDRRLDHGLANILSEIQFALYYYKVYDPRITEPLPLFEPVCVCLSLQ